MTRLGVLKSQVKVASYIGSSYLCICAQLCLSLCDPMDCSPPGSSSVHRILQARVLEWVAISRGFS